MPISIYPSQLQRILGILSRIYREPDSYSRAKLAVEFGVSIKTIGRDIRKLRESGIDIESGPEGYRIRSKFFLPPINFDLEEALALILAVRSFSKNEGRHLRDKLESALSKLFDALPDSLRAELPEVSEPIRVNGHKLSPIDKEIFERLREAIRNHRTVKIKYRSPRNRLPTYHIFEPYWLVFRKRAFYLIGKSVEVDFKRVNRVIPLRLNRVESVRLLMKSFQPPEMNLDEYLSKAWEIMPSGEEVRVVVRFSPKLAVFIEEVDWHPTQKIRRLEDGSLLFEVRVCGTDEIGWWLMGFPEMEVLEPPELREKVVRMAEEILRRNRAKVESRGSRV